MKKKTDDFNLVNLPSECSDPSISKDDFKLVQVDAKIHDQKFETKPTTFLKDCIKRFRKNKSSVVAAFILGFLIVLSIIVPIAFKTSDIHDTSVSHPEIYYLEPKLFDAGTGFWDGTKKYENIPVDPDTNYPDGETFNKNAISELKVGEEQYIDTANEFAVGGYFQLGYYDVPDSVEYVSVSTQLAVSDLLLPDAKETYPDVTNNMKDIVITEVIHPESLEQKSKVDPLDFAVRITYKDTNEDDAEKMDIFAVKEVILNTNSIGTVTGTVKVSNVYGEFSQTFTINIIENKFETFTFDQDLVISNFVTYDEKALSKSGEKTKTYPKGYVEAKSALYLVFEKDGTQTHEVALTEYKLAHDIGGADAIINVQEKFAEYCLSNVLDLEVTDIQLEIRVENSKNHKNSCTLIKSLKLESSSTNPIEKKCFESYSFEDGNDVSSRSESLWVTRDATTSKYTKTGCYLARARLCSFVYDTYEAVLGAVTYKLFNTDLEQLTTGEKPALSLYCDIEYDSVLGEYVVNKSTFECKILDKKECPLVKEFTAEDVVPRNDAPLIDHVNCEVYRYKMDPYNLKTMPKFILGTDKTGRDMFIYVFEGLRTSLLLGIATSAVCFLFGLIYGSIAGYFGGTVDLVMERFTDILSGVPWIVVMTLTIIHLGSTFITFAIALCLTGWIGTAATTRTQFYRFRGREYVLASRTLGASHGRLIAKHILPNAMGTIITSAVLMVPSIIFSEATISYLGLGFKNLASLGVILSDNQVELTNHPYLLIFPSIIIALLMISFNLFGNGLRDAVNPSLKGEGE